MKVILFVVCCLCFVAAAFPQAADSTTINRKYNFKQQTIKVEYEKRVEELLKSDPLLNQLRGASMQLEIERRDELQSTLPDSVRTFSKKLKKE